MWQRFRFVHWLCLVAYTWAATGIGDTLAIGSLIAEHPAASIVFDMSPGQALVAHHRGHRDSHEPAAIDPVRTDATVTTDAEQAHVDHVISLTRTPPGGFSAISHQLDLLSSVLPAIPSFFLQASVAGARLRYLDPPPTHNSRIAFVQLTQLRI